MEYENYLMKKPNEQGYRILDGKTINECGNANVVFEWALIDRGEGRTPCVGHWVSVGHFGEWSWEMEDIQWSYGHYFNTLEEAEVFYRKKVMKEIQDEIALLKEILAEEHDKLREARKALPEEEE